MDDRPVEAGREQWWADGWPPCAQAQADGVPCPEIGRDCEECEKAFAYVKGTRPGSVGGTPEDASGQT
jgi:hypothetical protein